MIDKYERLLNKIEKAMNERNLENMKVYTDKLYSLAEKNNNHYYEIIYYYYHSIYFYMSEKINQAIIECMKGLEVCAYESNYLYELRINNMAGILYADISNHISSLHYFIKAYYVIKDHNLTEYQPHIMRNISTLLYSLGMFEEAYKNYRNIYKLLNEMQADAKQKLIVIANIMQVLTQLDNMDEFYVWKKRYDELDTCEEKKESVEYILSTIYEEYKDGKCENVKEKFDGVLDKIKNDNDQTHIKNTIMYLMNVSMYMENGELIEYIYSISKDIIKKIHNPYFEEELSMQYIQILMRMEPERVKDEIYKNFDLLQNAFYYEKENVKTSIKMKIDLENTLYRQREIIQRNQELIRSKELDDFTNLLNKTSFRRYVEKYIRQKSEYQCDLYMMIDIDNFKEINDLYGHLTGDTVIRKLAVTLKQQLRQSDLIGRFGGDEFAVYMANVSSVENVERKANQLMDAVHHMDIGEHNLHISISAGIYMVNRQESYDQIFMKADKLLYEAKTRGRNQYIIA